LETSLKPLISRGCFFSLISLPSYQRKVDRCARNATCYHNHIQHLKCLSSGIPEVHQLGSVLYSVSASAVKCDTINKPLYLDFSIFGCPIEIVGINQK